MVKAAAGDNFSTPSSGVSRRSPGETNSSSLADSFDGRDLSEFEQCLNIAEQKQIENRYES